MSITNEQREKNLTNLKTAVDFGRINEFIIKRKKDWGGANVIITSCEEDIFDPKTDEDDWYGRKSMDLYVLTKHSKILSGLFYYVKENVLDERDNYLYGFMALLANDYLRNYGDDGDYRPLLKYIIDKIYEYFVYFDWEVSMDDSKVAFDVMRSYLSDKTCDDEIKKIL